MNMWQLKMDQKAKIVDFSTDISLAQKTRLQDLGFLQKEVVVCVKRIPFGGPSIFRVQSSQFALEKSVASQVLVELVE
jgi:ferrous iron transport protein A